MTSIRSLTALAIATSLAFAPSPAAAQEAETVEQFWPEANVYVRLNEGQRLFFLVAPVRERNVGQSEIQVGAHWEIGLSPRLRAGRLSEKYDADRLRYLRFRAGIRYATSLDESDTDEEWRGILELTPRARLPGDIIGAFRNRGDLRWINGDFSWRYRPRVWLEREFGISTSVALVPYGSAEIFYDSRYEAWSRTRYQLGVAVPLSKEFAPEVYLSRQRDEEPTLKYTNALGFVLGFYF